MHSHCWNRSGPPPELVGALTEVGHVEALQGRLRARAIALTERALDLAEELGLTCPRAHARLPGPRPAATSAISEVSSTCVKRSRSPRRRGKDARWRCSTTTSALALWVFEGPEGIAGSDARGGSLSPKREDSRRWSTPPWPAPSTSSSTAGCSMRHSMAPRLAAAPRDRGHRRAHRGSGAGAPDPDTARASRRDGRLPRLARGRIARDGCGGRRPHRAWGHLRSRARGWGQTDRAAALLTEIEATPGVREALNFAAYLPAMVRIALAIGDRDPRRAIRGRRRASPSLRRARAGRRERGVGRGQWRSPDSGRARMPRPADRWKGFGVVPERGFALLGQGRCLLGLARTAEALNVLRAARQIFDELDAAPICSPADALLTEALTRSS